MNNLQYDSAERNHYFYGKLMTVRDFENEQTYMNDKRRLGNRMLHGAGIVSGLGVLLVDNQTISLEAGMALDYLGREIVVREPCVKQISVLRGFDEIHGSGDVYLGIAYREELCEGTFSVAGAAGQNGMPREYNRVQEGYELFLTTCEPNPAVLGVDNVLYDLCRLYDENGVTITLQIPRFAAAGDSFAVRVLFEKRDVSAPVHFSFTLESDMFRGENGERSVRVDYTETEVTTHKRLELDYTMACGPVQDDYTEIRVPANGFSLSIGSREGGRPEDDVVRPVRVSSRPLREVVTDAYFDLHFDDLLTAREGQAIYLAKLHVIASQSTYFIEKITRNPFRQHLLSAQLLGLLQSIDKAPSQALGGSTAIPQAADSTPELPGEAQQILTGAEVINLGVSPKVGRAYFSHEFIHGLGPGNICVVVAAENTARQGDPDTLIFGSGGVFSTEEFSLAAPACQTAAMLNAKKGTLQLGVKLLEKTSQQTVRLRWWAWRPSGEPVGRNQEVASDVRVVITPNTSNLEPLQQLRFTAVVEGCASQEVNWSVVEKNGGSIDRNGLYTAPAMEGVFEVQAQSVKYGNCHASAFVVVSKA